MTVDDLIDSLVSKLGDVSEVWTDTFPPDPSGYARLEKLIRDYDRATVREALQFALEEHIIPQGRSAMPLLIGLCRSRKKEEVG